MGGRQTSQSHFRFSLVEGLKITEKRMYSVGARDNVYVWDFGTGVKNPGTGGRDQKCNLTPAGGVRRSTQHTTSNSGPTTRYMLSQPAIKFVWFLLLVCNMHIRIPIYRLGEFWASESSTNFPVTFSLLVMHSRFYN